MPCCTGFLVLVICIGVVQIQYGGVVEGHGRLMNPAGRSSAWRVGFPTPANYDDNSLNCGGFWYEYGEQDGKCGLCGDPWGIYPRPNEVGGIYATGTIVQTYVQGQTIAVAIQITAAHLGWFEFRICSVDSNPAVEATQDCLDKNLLNLTGGGGSRYPPPGSSVSISVATWYNVSLSLPAALSCNHCVLQWRYHAGNNWGTDATDPNGCVGCGPQEEFWGCADVTIKPSKLPTPPQPPKATSASNVALTTSSYVNNNVVTVKVQTTSRTTSTQKSKTTTSHSTSTTTSSKTSKTPKSKTTTTSPSTRMANVVYSMKCVSVGIWKTVPGITQWCMYNCPSNCPPSYCSCTLTS